MGTTKTSSYRLQYIDWLRGIGAVIMLQGHVFDSFTRTDLHSGGPWMMSQFLGGMPPAIFLFLTGVTLSFLMDSTERKGMAPMTRVSTAFRRSGYLFFLAFAFRLQMWAFGWPAPWTDLFKVDILNAMGFAIAVLSVMAFFRTVERVRLCAGLGLAIAFASPLVSQIDSSGLPWLVRDYIVPSYSFFGFFPWAAYLAFGMSAGSAIRAIPPDATERAIQWVALIGAALVIAAHYFGNMGMSVYPKSEFWLNSPAQVLIKQGVIFLLMALAFIWTRYGAQGRWSWVRQFGTTSLLVYWVHIELVYGRWFWFLKGSLDVIGTVIVAVVVILLMLAISSAKTYRRRIGARISAALSDMGWSFGPRPDRVPGD